MPDLTFVGTGMKKDLHNSKINTGMPVYSKSIWAKSFFTIHIMSINLGNCICPVIGSLPFAVMRMPVTNEIL